MATKTITRARSGGRTAPLRDEDLPEILLAAPATLTVEQLVSLDAKIKELEESSDGPCRRMSLACLTKAGKELIEHTQRDDAFAKATAELEHALAGYIGRVEELLTLLRQAQGRMIVMLATRTDALELFALAEKPQVLHG